MADHELTVSGGELFELTWTVSNVPVTNWFVNADGTAQKFPDSKKAQNPSRVEITVEKGHKNSRVKAHFRTIKKAPKRSYRTGTKKDEAGKDKTVRLKHFSLKFRAYTAGIYYYTIKVPDTEPATWKVTIRYRTIEEVVRAGNKRRMAVLATAGEFLPAFNTWTPTANHAPAIKIGDDSGMMDQGAYIASYVFDGDNTKPGPTSCTKVNPLLMGAVLDPTTGITSKAGNSSKKWAFNAGPAHADGKNPAWVDCDEDNLPSVGDTYIVLNSTTNYGHVGIILQVPKDGNGLWVTADGGQGGKPKQLAIIVPRWGLMGAKLPKNSPARIPNDKGAPYLSGARPKDINQKVDPPKGDGDVPGIIDRISAFPSPDHGASPSNPRLITGYVNLDDKVLAFDIDKGSVTSDMKTKIGDLARKRDLVINACINKKAVMPG